MYVDPTFMPKEMLSSKKNLKKIYKKRDRSLKNILKLDIARGSLKSLDKKNDDRNMHIEKSILMIEEVLDSMKKEAVEKK